MADLTSQTRSSCLHAVIEALGVVHASRNANAVKRLVDAKTVIHMPVVQRNAVLFAVLVVMQFAGCTRYSQTPDTGTPKDAQQLQLDKAVMENEKLKLEIERLREEKASPLNKIGISTQWVTPAIALIGVLASGLVAWITARRTRIGSFQLALLNTRLKSYPEMEAATMPFALYFPTLKVSPTGCLSAGKQLRKAYFNGAGIVLSKHARDCYFTLAEALTRAAKVDGLNVPAISDYARFINDAIIDDYRKALHLDNDALFVRQRGFLGFARRVYRRLAVLGGLPSVRSPTLPIDDVRTWTFGADTGVHRSILDDVEATRNDVEPERKRVKQIAELFRDFVMLQKVSSQLRTALADDIGGRSGRPG